jgi:hypothetical protein
VEKRIPGVAYTLIETVMGRGDSGTRRGSAIWPELNVLYLVYGTRQEASLIAEAVEEVKKTFPREGIKLFQFELSPPGASGKVLEPQGQRSMDEAPKTSPAASLHSSARSTM